MRIRTVIRAILWSVLSAVLLAALAAGAGFLLASRVPHEYQPPQLSNDQRQASAKQFVAHMGNNFWNNLQLDEPFTWTATQDQLNRYLASMDEIDFLSRPSAKLGDIRRAMDAAGLADPAVALGDGKVTLMIRSRQYDKVLSADLAFDFPAPGMLHVRLLQARLGVLPAPQSLLDDLLARYRQRLVAGQRVLAEPPTGKQWSVKPEAVLTQVLLAMGQAPVPALLPKVNGRRFRIDAIQIADGNLTLHLTPAQ